MSPNDDKVVALFATEEELEAAWAKYDALQKRVIAIYESGEPDADVRRAAVYESMAAEREFRAIFERARPRPVRHIAGQ